MKKKQNCLFGKSDTEVLNEFYASFRKKQEEKRKALQSMITEMLQTTDKNFRESELTWLTRLNGKVKYSDKEDKIITEIYQRRMK